MLDGCPSKTPTRRGYEHKCMMQGCVSRFGPGDETRDRPHPIAGPGSERAQALYRGNRARPLARPLPHNPSLLGGERIFLSKRGRTFCRYFLRGRGSRCTFLLHTPVALLRPPIVQSGIYEQASGIFLAYFAHEGSGFDTVLMQGL